MQERKHGTGISSGDWGAFYNIGEIVTAVCFHRESVYQGYNGRQPDGNQVGYLISGHLESPYLDNNRSGDWRNYTLRTRSGGNIYVDRLIADDTKRERLTPQNIISATFDTDFEGNVTGLRNNEFSVSLYPGPDTTYLAAFAVYKQVEENPEIVYLAGFVGLRESEFSGQWLCPEDEQVKELLAKTGTNLPQRLDWTGLFSTLLTGKVSENGEERELRAEDFEGLLTRYEV